MPWNSSGEQLITTSADMTVKVLDYNTSKVLYEKKTQDGSKILTSKIYLFYTCLRVLSSLTAIAEKFLKVGQEQVNSE